MRSVNPNVILADNGLIDVGPDGTLADWKAYCLSAGMSAQIILKDPSDREVYDRTYAVLKHMRDEGIYGIGEVYTAEEATHGYYPDKGPQPVFIGYGPDIKPGVVLERRPTVDEAPTYARVLGVGMPWADGHAIDEFFV